jgi:hypothetical protein
MTRLPETQDVPDEVYAQAAGVFTEDQYRGCLDDHHDQCLQPAECHQPKAVAPWAGGIAV